MVLPDRHQVHSTHVTKAQHDRLTDEKRTEPTWVKTVGKFLRSVTNIC